MAQATGFQPNNTPPPQESELPSLVTRGGSSDAALMEVSIKIARQFPRDEKKLMEQLRSTLELYPQFAEKALYSYPVKDRRQGRTVYIEGLSIRAAETLKSAWGNMRSGVRIIGEDEGGVDLEAVALDMEKNVWELVPGRALKTMKTQEGRLVMLDERTFLQARGAAASKANRNAILAVLPLHVKAFFEAEVRKHMAGGEENQAASSERVTRALARFEKEYRVTQAKLETFVGKPVSMWIGSDIVDLQKLFNGLEQGEVTVAEVFAVETPDAPAPNAPVVIDVKEGQLKAPDARPPDPEPEPKPVPRPMPPPPKPRAEKKARAVPYVIPPTQVEMPAATPVGPGTIVTGTPPEPLRGIDESGLTDETALRLRLTLEINGASTPDACDAILGRIYSDKTVPREVKRDALDWVQARRDALQAQSQ